MGEDTVQPSPETQPEPSGAPPQTDAAQRSLADALRLSFRLLSFIMIAVLVALLLTGLTQIHPGQRGVKLLFGRIQGEGDDRVLDEGLKWSWPEPVGQVEKVHVGEQTLVISDFWYHETPALELDIERGMPMGNEGLRPGWDGALLTGDRALVHVKFTCNYRIGIRTGAPSADAIIEFVSNTIDPEEVLRSAVCNAAIRAAATRTVDAILTTGKEGFRRAVEELAQGRLDEFRSGIRIEAIQISAPKVPLAAVEAFNQVISSRQLAQTRINQAVGDVNSLLARTAGASWQKLTGDLNDPGKEPGLLGRYAQARERGDQAAADELLEEIDRVLLSNETTGSAAGIINEARAYSARISRRVASRADQFSKLIDQYLAAPELTLQKLWADTKEEILTAPGVEQYYLTVGEKTILRINQDPEVRRRLLDSLLRAKRDEGPGTSARPRR